VAPGKEERVGVHRNGGSTARRRKQRRAAVFNGSGVTPVVVDEGGWVLQLEGDPGVRRRRSIERKSNSQGHSPEGGAADGGNARMESSVEEGFWRWITGEVDAGAMGTKAWRSGMDRRDKRRAGEEKDQMAASGSVLRERRGGGPGWVDAAWR
jgi:hypothetical protein